MEFVYLKNQCFSLLIINLLIFFFFFKFLKTKKNKKLFPKIMKQKNSKVLKNIEISKNNWKNTMKQINI